jgi:uncharacterized protein (DUF433 family)
MRLCGYHARIVRDMDPCLGKDWACLHPCYHTALTFPAAEDTCFSCRCPAWPTCPLVRPDDWLCAFSKRRFHGSEQALAMRSSTNFAHLPVGSSRASRFAAIIRLHAGTGSILGVSHIMPKRRRAPVPWSRPDRACTREMIVNNRIAGARITIGDVLHYLETRWSCPEIAETLPLSETQVEAIVQYIEDHKEKLLVVHRQIEDRKAQGNPPAMTAKLVKNQTKL